MSDPTQRDLIYLAPHRWDTITQRAQQLTTALARRHRVLYVEPVAPSLAGNVRRLATGRGTGPWRGRLTRRDEHLWSYTPPPTLPLTMDLAGVNRLAHALVAPLVRRVLADLRFSDPLVVAGWPLAEAWAGQFGEVALIYDCMDDFPAFPQPRRRQRLLEASERALARRAALITVTSEQLGAKWRSQHQHVYALPNGVTDAFLTATAGAREPADLAAIPRPRLLYFGAISRWLDDATLAQVACIHPEWSLVLIGPVEADMRALRRLPNVHILGPRPHEELPGYLAATDACLIPFTISPLTTAVNPVKLYEYLAAGQPVVSTALPEVERYAPLCYVTSDRVSFVRAAERAVCEARDDVRRARRRQVAAENTWTRRAAAFDALLAEHLPHGARP